MSRRTDSRTSSWAICLLTIPEDSHHAGIGEVAHLPQAQMMLKHRDPQMVMMYDHGRENLGHNTVN